MLRLLKFYSLIGIVVVLVSCGDPDMNQIVNRIDRSIGNLEAYQAKAKMIMYTGEKPANYDIDIWYKSPEFYRIHLANEDQEISQIILKNQEGVFVLTPELKKSFRFQSNWPEKQSQVYLYQSLIRSIQKDEQRTMAVEGQDYVFQVQADYAHEHFTQQRIWLDNKQLTPKRVEVMDRQMKTVIQLEFTTFNLEAKFEDYAFDRERNIMSSISPLWPSRIQSVGDEQNKQEIPATKQSTRQFGVIEPAYLPPGTKKLDISEMKIDEEPAILLRYHGTYPFSLIEQRPKSKDVYMGNAEMIELGYTTGILSGNDSKCLTWMAHGVEFRLISKDLPLAEMIKVAQAVEGQSGK